VRDKAEWDALVERLSQPVWAKARSRGLGTLDAAEVCQLAWLRLADHVDELVSDVDIAAWLCAVVDDEASRATGARSMEPSF
jgi:DNA-directed RNA polymerase specialized sigma24 family protein